MGCDCSLCSPTKRSAARRYHCRAEKTVKGLEWDAGAIGTAEWGGARLRDVLRVAGIREDDPEIHHIQVGSGWDPDGIRIESRQDPGGLAVVIALL